MPSKGDKAVGVVRTTGGRVDDMVIALLDAAYDKDVGVRDVVAESLCELGSKHPALVLSSCNSYLIKQSKLASGHRVVILSAMERVIRAKIADIDEQLAVDVIQQSSAELTQTKEVVPDWQTAASAVLVAFGSKYCNEVMTELLEKFQPGVLPHYFVVQTLANLSVANVFGMVPYIKLLLGTMLPMLGMAKQENIKWVLSTALSRFCEAIVEYMANISTAPDPSVRIEFFSSEVFSAWEVFFNVWLQSKESKVRCAVMEALGHMSYIMERNKLQECLPRLIPTILGFYKKHSDQPVPVTQSLCMILDACSQSDLPMLEQYIDVLQQTLFTQISQPIDYRVPASVKNHNELLRCFAILTKQYSNRLVPFVLQKLESVNNEKVRIAGLLIVRHLVNTSGPSLDDKKDLLLSGMKQVLPDANNKVKKVLSQTIIAMAHHEYLELEGGHLLIEFIVRQCALPADSNKRPPPDPDYVSNESLRKMCENILQLLSTTVDKTDNVLWPYLLELLTIGEFSDAVGIVCSSIQNVIGRKSAAGETDYNIDFTAQVNLPKPPELFARFIVIIGHPLTARGRGLQVIGAMQCLAAIIHPDLQAMWDTVLPKLSAHLAENSQDGKEWSQKSWEDLILKLLSKSLDLIKDETWFASCGDALLKHIPLYTGVSDEKNFLFKCMGALMRKSTKKDLVNKLLDAVFSNVKHSDPVEREGCAVAAGFAAASHLDLVLSKLESVLKADSRKSSSFLDFFKDSSGETDEKLKATLMLSYGYVTLCAPVELIVSRLEASVLSSIVPQLTSVKDRVIKQNLIRSVELIAQAMHPSHLKTNFNFTQRNSLLQHLKMYVKSESTQSLTNETRALALHACATLIKLDPRLSDSDIQDLVKVSLVSVVCCTASTSEAATSGNEQESELLKEAMLALRDLLLEIAIKDTSIKTFDLLFQLLQVYMKSTQDYERQRSMTLLFHLLDLLHKHVAALATHGDRWELTGRVFAWIMPRCMDPRLPTRMTAYDCVILMMKIMLRLQGKDAEHKDEIVESMNAVKDVANGDVHSNPAVSNSAVELAKAVAEKLVSEQIVVFLTTLYDCLLEPNTDCALVVIMVLKEVVKKRGSECHAQVIELMNGLIDKMVELPIDSRPVKYCGDIMSEFARHHLLRALNLLLDKPLPWSEHLLLVWQSFGDKEWLAGSILEQLLDMLSRCQPYEELSDTDSKTKKPYRRAFALPLAVSCAVAEIAQSKAGSIAVRNDIARILAALLTLSASMIGTKPPKYSEKQIEEKNRVKTSIFSSSEMKVSPVALTLDALQVCSAVSGSVELSEHFKTVIRPRLVIGDNYHEDYVLYASRVVDHIPSIIPKLITYLNPVLSSIYYPQRIMATAVFSELIGRRCGGDMALVEMLTNSLLGRLIDSELTVRMLCVRGLGNIASSGKDQVQKYCTMVLSAMMSGMDDKEDSDDMITLEAMSGLSKILSQVSEKDVQAILINVALRIRPCFEKDKCAVRAAAFELFGNLSIFGAGTCKEQFLEQIHTNFVSLLLHLNDSEQEVKQACKRALRQLGPLIGSDGINTMFQNHLIDGTAVLHYGEFINDLCKVIVRDCSTKLNNYLMSAIVYFKSQEADMRSNASIFVGFLVGNMTAEQSENISKQQVCSAIVNLLKDPEPDVRLRAAEAISHMSNI